MKARKIAKKKIRKILLIGILCNVYGILNNYYVYEFEEFFTISMCVLIIDVTALFTIVHLCKKYMEKEEKDRNS